jgi:outer membrane protein OmpA-like peptidoglycan-associated protein
VFTSCRIEKPEVLEDPNIRVIELEPEQTNADIELNATREELSRYDCDLNWILFDYNSYELSNTAKLELEKVALIIEQNDNFKARIRAFTDSKGRPEYNEKLSARRANEAKQYLISEGISPKNISVDSYAEDRPIAINTEDDTGRKYNRRIELFVLDKLNNTVCRSHPPKIPNSLKLEFQ